MGYSLWGHRELDMTERLAQEFCDLILNCLSLLFETQRRLRRPKTTPYPHNKKTGDLEGLLYMGGPLNYGGRTV